MGEYMENMAQNQIEAGLNEREELYLKIIELEGRIKIFEKQIEILKKCDNCCIRPCDIRYKNKVCTRWNPRIN